MKFLGNAVQAGFVCLTAVSTLIAGVPHFDCVCPTGQHKPFCLGISSPRTGCCCAGSCCSGGKCCCQGQDSSPDAQVEHMRCCKSQRQPSSDVPATGSQVNSSSCTKIVAQSEFLSISPKKMGAEQNLMDGFSVPLPQLVSASPAPVPGQSLFSRHRCDLPPPPDLVITLQHFLI